MPDLVGRGADFGFYSKGGGSPGGLWAEAGRYRTQVLTGDFWLLQGGHTMEAEGGGPGEERKLFRDVSALMIPTSNNGDQTRVEAGGREMGRFGMCHKGRAHKSIRCANDRTFNFL